MLERVWWQARLYHADPKKLPKRPELLWNPDADKQTPHQMLQIAMAWASNGEEIRKKLQKKTVH